MRYAYVKANDVVQELRRVSRTPLKLPEGGPDAYVAHFLRVIGNEQGLLLSTHSQTPTGDFLRCGRVTARSFYWHSRHFRTVGKLARNPIVTFWPRMFASVKIFLYLVRFRPDKIVCWATAFPLWSTFLAARICSSQFVYSRHNRLVQDNEPWFRRLTSSVDKWFMRRSTAVIAHGPFLIDELRGIGIDPSRLIEFNWSFQDFYNEAQRPKILAPKYCSETTVILYVGRITALKGVFRLLDACAERLRSDSAIALLYAGMGPDLDKLRRRVETLGLSERVHLLGMVPHEELGTLIKQSKIVVTPTSSNYPEGRCMAAIESLVMGIPVIAPNFGPFPYLVRHGYNGLLFKPDSSEDLNRNIFKVLDEADLYEHLCVGASESSKTLRQSSVNFSEALRRAFSIGGNSNTAELSDTVRS